MEKRIQLIYLLSLLAALVAIGVQGYWLYSQFRYEMQRYGESVAEKVKEIGNDEFGIRRRVALGTKVTYILDRNVEHRAVSEKETSSRSSAGFQFMLKDTATMQTSNLNLKFDPFMSEDSLLSGVERSVVNHFVPFSGERLDSLLKVRLPGYKFSSLPLAEKDTLNPVSSWQLQKDGLLSSSLIVKYMYAPFDKKGILLTVSLPFHPLLVRMGGQLGLSLFLILLLVFCLWFQIRTILEQKRIGEMREGFVHTMIHELRRPVQALKMCVTFLNDKDMRMDEKACSEVSRDALFELDNLSAYLGKLKDMVCADGGNTPLNVSSFNLQELVEKVLHFIQIPSGKQVSFSIAFPPDLPFVTADPVHMANVLCNLVENAIKYSGPEVDIRIVVHRKEKGIELSVEDNGFGISLNEQRKVFEKFYRSTNLSGRQIPGLGLGLSYVRQIVEAHRGKVSLLSGIGQGTKVIVAIPQ